MRSFAQADPQDLLSHQPCCPGRPNVLKGQVIFSSGERAKNLYFLHYGRIKLYHVDPQGRRLILDLVPEGSWFGTVGWLGPERYPFYAEAMSKACVCHLDRYTILRAQEEQPAQVWALLEALQQQEEALLLRMAHMFHAHVLTRLAQSLLWAVQRWGQPEGEGFQVRITHADLAQLAGSTRETTTICLQGLVRQGVIQTGYGSILIVDVDRLQAMADQEMSLSLWGQSVGGGSSEKAVTLQAAC